MNLFVIGSELRGLEIIRGPAWTTAGTTDGSGDAIWDYPFVAGLCALADDVRTTFDNSGYTKNLSTLENLITYSADWSSWMGWQHPARTASGRTSTALGPSNIDIVAFDNYLPLSDWTTGNGGAGRRQLARAGCHRRHGRRLTATMYGLGLSGPPTHLFVPYLKAQHRRRPVFQLVLQRRRQRRRAASIRTAPACRCRCREGDRLAQAREPYYAEPANPREQAAALVVEQSASSRLRRRRRRVGSAGTANRMGREVEVDHYARIRRARRSTKATNQPNVFFDAKSTESCDALLVDLGPARAGGRLFCRVRDDTIQALALEAIYEYWNVDGNNETRRRRRR